MSTKVPFYKHGLTSIPAWISNSMPTEVWDEITHLFPNFNGTAFEVWECISTFILHVIVDVITLGLQLTHVSKRGPKCCFATVHMDKMIYINGISVFDPGKCSYILWCTCPHNWFYHQGVLQQDQEVIGARVKDLSLCNCGLFSVKEICCEDTNRVKASYRHNMFSGNL